MKKRSKRRPWTSVQVRELKSLAKKSAREENCKDSEAHRRRDPPKGIQSRVVAGLSRVTSRNRLATFLTTPPLTCAGLFPNALIKQAPRTVRLCYVGLRAKIGAMISLTAAEIAIA